MNFGRVLFYAIFFLAVVTLLTVSSALESAKNSISLPLSLEQEMYYRQQQQELEKEYKENIVTILENFSAKQDQLSSQEIKELEDQLLALKVPANLTSLHFDLVSSLGDLQQTTESEAKKILQERMEKLLQQYSWLTSILSQFIMYNF